MITQNWVNNKALFEVFIEKTQYVHLSKSSACLLFRFQHVFPLEEKIQPALSTEACASIWNTVNIKHNWLHDSLILQQYNSIIPHFKSKFNMQKLLLLFPKKLIVPIITYDVPPLDFTFVSPHLVFQYVELSNCN